MNAARVGLFTECYRPIQNGVVASVEALAVALREREYQPAVVTPYVPGYRDDERSVVRLPSLPLPLPTAYRLTVPYLPPALGRLSIVHAHSPFITGLLGAFCARRARIPLVFTYHTQLEAYAHYVPFEAGATRDAATRLTRAYANIADAVVVPTTAMERRLRELGVRSRIVVVPSGIDVAVFGRGRRSENLRARLGAAPHEKMLLAVGRLGREKNIELTLAAFARLRLPDVRLVIVGDGPHRTRLELEAARLGVAARTTFAREFPRAALPDAYASADAFAFASRSETQGLVLVEAMAAGLPVVALDTPQTREVLAGAGALVPDDPDAFARSLERVLECPHGLATAGRRVAESYDAAALGDRVIGLYGDLLASRRRPATSPPIAVDIERTFDVT